MARTAIATPRFKQRQFVSSLLFAGATDNVSIPSNATQNTSVFSYAAWIYPTGSGNRTIKESTATAGPGFRIASGKLNLVKQGAVSMASSTGTIYNNQWQHVAVTYSDTTGAYAFYINGVVSGSGTRAAVTFVFGANAIGISAGSTEVFVGNITNFVWTDTIMTSAEVAALYYQGTLPAGVVGNYAITGNSGTNIIDSSATANNGTLTGATFSRNVPTITRKVLNPNLVYNGDFEIVPPFVAATTTVSRFIDGTATGSTTNATFGWSFSGSGGGGNSAQFDTATFHSGTASLKASTTATGKYVELFMASLAGGVGAYNQKTTIKVQPNTTYTYSFWMKTNYVSGDSSDGAYTAFIFTKADGTTDAGGGVSTAKVKTTQDWTQYTASFTTTTTAVWMQINPRIYGHTGTATLIMDVWWDDFVIKPLSPLAFNQPQSQISAARKLVNNNLVSNGDFEFAPTFTAASTTTARWIVGTAAGSTTDSTWLWGYNSSGANAPAKFDTSVSHSGTTSMKISTLAAGQFAEVNRWATDNDANHALYSTPVKASTSYTCTFWMKTTYVSGDATNGAFMSLREYNKAGTAITSTASTAIKTTTDWTQYTITKTMASTTTSVSTSLLVYGHQGTATLVMDAWFDDIVLRPTTPVARTAVA